MPTQATGLRAARAEVLARTELTGAALRSRLSAVTEECLRALFADALSAGRGVAAVALVAVGSYGRRDPAAGSDLDLVLLGGAGGRREAAELAAVAERLWYPVWDSGVGLDHAVRTVEEARTVARGDLKAALGLLDARYIAGDPALADSLVAAVREDWRRRAGRRLPELAEFRRAQGQQYGELAYLLEPDLKEAAGGLRDVHALHAISAAWLADPPNAVVRAAGTLLLDVRGELQRLTGRGSDRLLMQEQPAVARALGIADADALITAVSAAGRTISHAADHTWRRVTAVLTPAPTRWRARPAARRPLADGVVEQGGEAVLARDAEPAADPTLVLRAAAAAAEAGVRLSEHTVERLSRESAPMPQPWPPTARAALVTLLGAGAPAVGVLESLDQAGLLVRLLPEWAAVRCRPQRNAVHRYTVDRHLVETAVQAAAFTRRVSRPDLLLLAALLHDLGKGYPGADHSASGADVVGALAPRLGYDAADTDVLVRLTRHHLLLTDTATRRDLDDPATAAAVAQAVGDRATLDLLHALTEADARATGEGLWTEWKAALVAALVRRTGELLDGAIGDPAKAGGGPPLAARVLAERGEFAVSVQPGSSPGNSLTVTVAAPNSLGVLSAAAGVLAVNRLNVRAANAHSLGGMAVLTFCVEAGFGGIPPVERLTSDVRRALDGSLDLAGRLREREAAYPPGRPVAKPTVELTDAATGATVVEVRAHDSAGLLHRVSAALAGCGCDVRTALVSTFGAEAVDAFYVTSGGAPLTDPEQRAGVVAAVTAAAGSGDSGSGDSGSGDSGSGDSGSGVAGTTASPVPPTAQLRESD